MPTPGLRASPSLATAHRRSVKLNTSHNGNQDEPGIWTAVGLEGAVNIQISDIRMNVLRLKFPCLNVTVKLRSMRPKPQLWHRIQGAVDGYAVGIVRLIGDSYGRDTVQQAWQEFTSGAGQAFRGDDPHTELFFSWLFHRWSPTREKGSRVRDFSLYGVPPTRAYLNRSSSRLEPLLRRYLENCLVTSPGFYEIFNCEPHVGFGARDVMTGVECEVSEGLASTSLSNGDIMFAHLVPLEGTTMLEAISPLSFPPVFKKHLARLCRSRKLVDPRTGELRELYFTFAQPGLSRPAARMH
jgi:hypothetical protein